MNSDVIYLDRSLKVFSTISTASLFGYQTNRQTCKNTAGTNRESYTGVLHTYSKTTKPTLAGWSVFGDQAWWIKASIANDLQFWSQNVAMIEASSKRKNVFHTKTTATKKNTIPRKVLLLTKKQQNIYKWIFLYHIIHIITGRKKNQRKKSQHQKTMMLNGWLIPSPGLAFDLHVLGSFKVVAEPLEPTQTESGGVFCRFFWWFTYPISSMNGHSYLHLVVF